MSPEFFDCIEAGEEGCGAEDQEMSRIIAKTVCEAIVFGEIASRTAPVTPTTPPRVVEEEGGGASESTTAAPSTESGNSGGRNGVKVGGLLGVVGMGMMVL